VEAVEALPEAVAGLPEAVGVLPEAVEAPASCEGRMEARGAVRQPALRRL
jgi:hypothetical protein